MTARRVAEHNKEHCGNIARLITQSQDWTKDTFFATCEDVEGRRFRVYGKTAELCWIGARKKQGFNIMIYSSTLRARVL